jgi:hypothetical protein
MNPSSKVWTIIEEKGTRRVNKPQLGIHEYSSPNKGFSHCTKEEGIGE